jgi:diacylglycerol O-acyltransferase
MRLLQSSLSKDPNERDVPYAWVDAPRNRPAKRAKPNPADGSAFSAALEVVEAQLGAIPGAASAVARTLSGFKRAQDARMALPFEAPRSALNTKVTGARRFVAQSYSLERIDAVRKRFDATVNDVVLAMCSAALRRYLIEFVGGVPDKPLTAMAPVSVRPRDGEDYGNAASAVLVNLGTHIDDPVRRLETIRASVQDGKALIKELSFNEVMLYTLLMATPLVAPALMGLGSRLPAANIVISNVPGPKKPLFWNGASLEGMYPVSIVYHGMAVNITVTSYAGSLDFGIVACRRSVPRVQRIIDFLEEGLVDLESAAG